MRKKSVLMNLFLQTLPQDSIYCPTPEEFESYKRKRDQWLKGKTDQPPPAHAVTIFGYGVRDGCEYYLCQNSWGPKWGHQGFFRVSITAFLDIAYPYGTHVKIIDP